MPIDIVDGSLLWDGLATTPPPPPPPAPTETGDGVMVPGMFGPAETYISTSTYPRRRRESETENPWVALIKWLRRLRRIDDQWEISQLAKTIELDDLDVMEVTMLSRRN